jgi:CRISPR-associated exonuclease Cas4
MEHTSALVAEGKFIGQTSYPQRADRWQELQIDGIKIDHYDAVQHLVREVKKSNKKEEAHIAQLKYYLYILRRHGVTAKKGILEYPRMRLTEEITLLPEETVKVQQWEQLVREITSQDICPDVIHKPMCKRCAYHDFCYAG